MSQSATQSGAESGVIGFQFTERMVGYVSTTVWDDYPLAFEQGKHENSPCEFTLTVSTNNLDQMLTNPDHKATLSGVVTIPALSSTPLDVVSGEFHLFVTDETEPETRKMLYKMLLRDGIGAEYSFDGFKVVRSDGIFNVWHDTTTLYVDIYRPDEVNKSLTAKGILHISPSDFAHQLTTIRALNAPNPFAALEAEGRFGRFFAGVLFDTYGGVFARPTAFNPDAPPRRKRTLRLPDPEVFFLKTADNVTLRLTHYCGGRKGPVLLAHGLGVSSKIFLIDTIETNLTEYLVEAGFDAWLLDFRASIELPVASTQFTADDIALYDYPAAVKTVLEKTGSESVQVLAHCYGATTFTMALCAGLKNVRSAVISQISAHIVPPMLNRIRTGLHLPEFLDALGIESLDAYVDTHADWENRLYDRALALYPAGQSCTNPVCRRITFMYAPLYRHEQLNQETHEALHEIFGIANMHAFEGLGLMTRRGHIVSATGQEVYLPNLSRMSIPITFIHGEENECFLPESTLKTFEELRQINQPELYKRAVIPGYGHIDCIFGKDAAKDVFPHILSHFEET